MLDQGNPMSESNPRLGLSAAATLRPALPILAVLCVLLALLFAWGGWGEWRDSQRSHALQESRDLAVQGTRHALQLQTDRLRERLASAPVQAALKEGNLAAAAGLIKTGWAHVEAVDLLPPDLATPYAGLPASGYGKLATAEAALAANVPIARVAKDAGGMKLVLAAPARNGDALLAVALVRLPLGIVTDALQAAPVADDTYLSLRQGNARVLERGDAKLADSAEALAAKIPDSTLRVAAGLPDETSGVFGLGPIASFVAALVMLGFAGLAWRTSRQPMPGVTPHAEGGEPTLADAIRHP